MSLIQTNLRHFPWDVFSPELYQNFKAIAANYNIPLNYLGVEALFSIAALSGNMYRAEINGGFKPIVYIAKIGPSTVGKTPAHDHVCGNIIKPHRIANENKYRQEIKDWQARADDAKKAKIHFDEDEPLKRIRVIEGGTVEAIAKHSITSPAGFGVVYDEGARMFGEASAYTKSTSAIDFWNQMYNGKTVEIIRVDQTRERFIPNPAVSVNIGLQTDRMDIYFDEETMQSGLLNRFLIVESDYIRLNENVDWFSQSTKICQEWEELMVGLFNKGLGFEYDQVKTVPFTDKAKRAINAVSSRMIIESNAHITTIKAGDASKYIASYRGKIFGYVPRLALILAIYKDFRDPVITEAEVNGADKLCQYFQQTANRVIRALFDSGNTGLNENEQRLLDALPDSFDIEIAMATCTELGLNEKFFTNSFSRKFRKGIIDRVGKGKYEKVK